MKEAFHHRHHRPAGPGADRHAQGHSAGQDCVPDYDAPMNLPGYQIENPQGQARADQADRRGDQAGQAAGDLRRRRHHQRRRQRRAARARQEDRHSRHDDRDGPGRVSQRRSAVARHARHARLVYANYAVEQADLLIALGVRFDDRVTGKVEEFCQARQDRPRRHRRLGAQQEQAGPHPRVQRREVRARRAEQDRRSRRTTSPPGSSSARSGRRTSRSTTTRTSPASCSSTRSASCRS